MPHDVKQDSTLYWRALGRLYPDNRLVLRPGYLSAREPRLIERPSGDLLVEMVDDHGNVLSRYPLSLARYCDDEDGTPPELAVRGRVPFHPETRKLRFIRAGLKLLSIRRSEASPEVRIAWTPPSQVSGEHRISWTAEHRERLPLQFFLRYTHTSGERWQRVNFRTSDHEMAVDFDRLPGGERCRIAVIATDGVNTTTAETEVFTVPVKPCQAMIFEPADGQRFRAGEPVCVRGQGFYLEENTAELEALAWTSSLDGDLGHGMFLELGKLSSGEHEITLDAGTDERIGRHTVRIFVATGDQSAP